MIQNDFTFEPVDSKHALCLAELVFKQKEVPKFEHKIAKQGIKITAIHNHWLFEDPHLIYIHLEAVQKPKDFAKKVAKALKDFK